MYIQNMTTEEMVREYRADLPEIERFNNHIDQSEFVAKQLNKSRKSGKLCFVRYCTTTRNNKYINVFQYVKTRDSTYKSVKWDWAVRSIALMQTYKGVCAIGLFDSANIAIVFQQHFFVRYKQRLSEICDWKTKNELQKTSTIEDIIAVWAKRNPDIIWINTKCKFDDREHIFAPINDGVILIQWDGQHIQANTFITEGMYSKKQEELLNQAENAKSEQALFQQLVELMEQNNNNY